MGRPRRRTGRPGPTRAGTLRVRPLVSADLDRLAPCGSACGLAALDPAELLAALGREEAIAYVGVDPDAGSGPGSGPDPGRDSGADRGAVATAEPDAPLIVVASPALAARCAWIPAEPGPDAWVVLGLRTGEARPTDTAVGRMLLRAAVTGLRSQASTSRVQAIEAWAGTADPCEGDVSWWRELGFVLVRPHPSRPRLRIDLRTLPVWRENAAYAWDRVTNLRRRPAPAPEAQRSGRPGQRSSRSSASRS